MSRAGRARRIAAAAAFGGGGVGALGAAFYGLMVTEVRWARKLIGQPFGSEGPGGEGLYGAGPGAPIVLAMLGDSTSVGLGAESPSETPGVVLAQGLAAIAGTQRSNRSLTAAEAELFRQVNVTLRDVGLPWVDYAHLIRYGAILRTVEHPAPEGAAPIRTPVWAVERAQERGAAFAGRIERLRADGLRVEGNLQDLTLGTPEAPPHPTVPDTVEVEVATRALLGVIARASTGATYFESEGRLTTGRPGDIVPSVVNTPAGRLTSKELATLLSRRVREGLERRARRLRS